MTSRLQLSSVLLLGTFVACAYAGERTPDPARGYRWLTQKAYLPADFNQATFDQTWKFWPEPLRSRAEKASLEQRRRMAFQRYGLTGRPEDPSKPLQYVVDSQGNWTMNCFSCHGGEVQGSPYPGRPNSKFALETLTADIRSVKLATQQPLTRMDIGSMVMPLGRTNGTTNAVMFGVALMAYRDADLNYYSDRIPPKMVHHDMDAPPWWHFKLKDYLYIDAFAQKGHRALMQFMLVQENGPVEFREWEDDFRDVHAYLESLEAPGYPFEVDQQRAALGRKIFSNSCADCHGTYGEDREYPNRVIAIERLGTDPVRLDALRPSDRERYDASWFAHFGKHETVAAPKGYIAPPLDGVWASAPYFHNGSVPTLWHVLNPSERPVVWRTTGEAYDRRRGGPSIEQLDRLPSHVRRPDLLREYFNTTRFGKSSAGHTFPDELSQEEKWAVLEYLKTL